MSGKKMDPKLLAFFENNGSELKTIAKRFKVKMKDLKRILVEIGQNGKPERSMDEVKEKLVELGYTYHAPKKKVKTDKLPHDTLPPTLPPSDVFVNG